MKQKIVNLVKKIKPQAVVSADTQLINGLLDSIEVITLLSSLEYAFDIIIPSQEIKADNFKNIETIVTLINNVIEDSQKGDANR